MSYPLYRTMRADADGHPLLGRARDRLGVVLVPPLPDVAVLDDGTVLPETGGMSVFIDPRKMPKSLRPRTLADKPGESAHPVFLLREEELHDGLRFRKDKQFHGLVEPRVHCKVEVYEEHLDSTRTRWRVAYAAP